MDSRKIFVRLLILLNVLVFYTFFVNPDSKREKKVAQVTQLEQILWHRLPEYQEVKDILVKRESYFVREVRSQKPLDLSEDRLIEGTKEEIIQYFKDHQLYLSQGEFYQILRVQAERIKYDDSGIIFFYQNDYVVIYSPHGFYTPKVELLEKPNWYFMKIERRGY